MAQLKNLLVLGSARFSNLIKGIVERAQNGCFYCTCATAAATAAKVVTTSDPGFALREGVVIGVKYSNSNSASNVTLNVNDTGAKSIYFDNGVYTGTEPRICGYGNRITYYMYDGTNWVFTNYSGNYTNTNTRTSAYCSTGAGTAAKEASCDGYNLKENSYLHITIVNANTAASALTLNVNSKGAKPIYINGSASSSTNYTLPAGSYICFYDGTNYYFRNDAVLPGEIEKATNVTGTVAPENGGTGKKSLTAAASALINALNTGPNDPVDDDYFISQYVGGGTSNTAYYRRPLSALWNYIKSKITKTVVTDALGYTPPISPFYREATPKATKTYTGVIATDTTAALSNFYAVKAVPTSYSGSWSILIHIKATITGVSEGNGLGFQESYFYVEGMRNTYATYWVWNNIRNTSYRPYYYNILYRAKSAGVTGGYGHIMGVGLRSSYNPTTAANSRTFTFDILDYTDCTVSFLDNMVVYANVPGTGTTNYEGLTEFNGSTQGITRAGTDNNYVDRLQINTFKPTAGASPIYPYTLCMKDSSGKYQSLVTSSSTGTSKARNTNGFLLEGIYYFNANATLDVNTKTTANSTFYTSIPCDLRYSTNCGTTLTVDAAVYLVGTMSNELFYLDSTWWTQTLPTTDDGKLYVFLGHTYTTTNIQLSNNHPIYWYKNGALREYFDEASLSTIPVSKGGTGATTVANARTNLGFGSAGSNNNPVYFDGGLPVAGAFTWGVDEEERVQVGWDGDAPEIEIPTSTALPIAQGGTGATTAAAARTNLGLGSAATYNVVSTVNNDNNLVTGAAVKTYYEAVGIPSAISTTSAATAAKVATCSSYSLLANSYIQVILANGNSASSALSLNINGKGAKTIYINGAVSSSSNKTLPAGSYFVFYDGTNYFFRTDGKITGDITGSAGSVSGVIEVANGGTGQTSLQAVRNAMGLGDTTGALPIANGGTGATSASGIRTNIAINDLYQIVSYSYTYTVPANTDVTITAANFGISAISNYTPVAMSRFTTGNANVICRCFDASVTSGNVLFMKNVGSTSVTGTATIALMFMRTNVKKS